MFVRVLEAGKSEVKVLADPVSSERLLQVLEPLILKWFREKSSAFCT